MRILSLPFLHGLSGLAPLFLRIGVGVVMALHGWTKWTQGQEGWLKGEMLVKLGLPYPEILAWVVLVTELVGGILIVLGLLTRIWAIGMAIEMIVVLVMVEGKGFPFLTPEGRVWAGELEWLLLFGALALLFLGPGKASLDALLRIERDAPAARFVGRRS